MARKAHDSFFCDDENYYVGGVCEGIARTLGVDVESVRIFTVVLTFLTFGVVGIAYLVLYVMLPKKHSYRPVDVAPTAVTSERYGRVVGQSSPIDPGRDAERRAHADEEGHMPPPAPGAPRARARAAASEVSVGLLDERDRARRRWALFAVFAGIAAVVVAMDAGLSARTARFRPGELLPLVLVAWGIVRMVIPDEHGSRTWTGSIGFLVALVGGMWALASCHVVGFALTPWFYQGAPLFAGALFLVVFGRARRSMIMMACGLALAIAFCAMGLLFFSLPGAHAGMWMPMGMEDVPFV